MEPFETQPLNNPEPLRPFVLGKNIYITTAKCSIKNRKYLPVNRRVDRRVHEDEPVLFLFCFYLRAFGVFFFLCASSVLLSFTARVQEANGAFRFPPSEVLNSNRIWAYHFTVPPTSFTSHWLTWVPIKQWSRLLTQWRKFVSSRHSTQGCHLEITQQTQNASLTFALGSRFVTFVKQFKHNVLVGNLEQHSLMFIWLTRNICQNGCF